MIEKLCIASPLIIAAVCIFIAIVALVAIAERK